MTVSIRGYRPHDLRQVLDLWQRRSSGADEGALTLDQAIELVGSDDAVTVVADHDDRVVGVGLGAVTSVVGWIYRVSVDGDEVPAAEIVPRLLEELEAKLAERGARRLGAVAPSDGDVRKEFDRRNYKGSDDIALLQREIPVTVATPSVLKELGGRMIEPDLWEHLRGMEEAKEIIERRVILPLAQPELAQRHAVSPPRAVVLFGPPGTGKTTFAKGIASRLEWPFIEINPAQLAGEGAERQAKLLARAFDLILELGSAVMFVDEVEDLASARDAERKVNASVTNEFLKQIPRFRDAPHHLLACATNAVGSLDPAFLRPGRFDYVLPVGPPDPEARREIWRRYVDEITDEEVDVDQLVEATDLFTPADIEFAARKAAQRAFEREHFEESSGRATTDDFMSAIKKTRPTLTEEAIEGFKKEMDEFARF